MGVPGGGHGLSVPRIERAVRPMLVEQRYRAVLGVLGEGVSVTGVAHRYGVVRQAERKKQEKLKAKCEAEEARRRQQGQ